MQNQYDHAHVHVVVGSMATRPRPHLTESHGQSTATYCKDNNIPHCLVTNETRRTTLCPDEAESVETGSDSLVTFSTS